MNSRRRKTIADPEASIPMAGTVPTKEREKKMFRSEAYDTVCYFVYALVSLGDEDPIVM